MDTTKAQPKITGYRQLNAEEARLMNAIKAHGAAFQILLDEVRAHLSVQWDGADDTEMARLNAARPHDWMQRSREDMAIALMTLTRAVAQPTSF